MVEGETLLVLLSVTRGHTLAAMAPPTSSDVEAAVQQQAAHDNKHSAGKKAQVMVEGGTLLVLPSPARWRIWAGSAIQ